MDLKRLLEEFQSGADVQFTVFGFILNMLLVAILAYLLGRLYIKYGNALSNRKNFARNFVPLAMTTMLVISIVKSSLALSLGLVGALSIVRFRSAIKEPEELTYVFMAIALGLGMGANQGIFTIIAFIILSFVIVLLKKARLQHIENQHLFLTVLSNDSSKIKLEQIVSILDTHCEAVNLKRLDESGKQIEASFLVDFDRFDKLNEAKQQLQALDETVKISYLDAHTFA